jgi:hypothetical protein
VAERSVILDRGNLTSVTLGDMNTRKLLLFRDEPMDNSMLLIEMRLFAIELSQEDKT